MANMDIAVVTLLFLSALLQVATANHCPSELTKPDQVIDIEQSKDLEEFDDIGVLHVDGETEEARMKECVDICCHAGDDCNVVSLEKSIVGIDGDNCHLFRCDPPEDCKWTVKDGFQSALLSLPVAATVSSVSTTSVSDTDTNESTTVADSDSTTTDSSDTTTDNITENTTANSEREKEDGATTEATATTEASGESEGTTTESSGEGETTTEDSQSTTEASATKSTKKSKEKEDAKASDNSTETTTVKPKKNVADAGEKNSTDSIDNSTTEAPLDDTTSATSFRTTTAAMHSSKEDTTVLIQSTNASLAPTPSIAATAFDNNDTQTPAPLRAKTADMSSNTVTALACALAAGAMFVGVIATVIGKRFYDNWHRRHYQQIDYLVDGM